MTGFSMTAKELQAWLKERFSKEDERHEWKEWISLKSNISGRKGEDLVSYISALANMDGGCIVIGVQDKTLAVTGIQDFADYTVEGVVRTARRAARAGCPASSPDASRPCRWPRLAWQLPCVDHPTM